MLCDSLEFYSDPDVEYMFDQWVNYAEELECKGILEDTPLGQVLKPVLPFTFQEVYRELIRRTRKEESR